MNPASLDRSFARIGARVRFGPGRIDVARDAGGEFFRLDLDTAQAGDYEALDVQPKRRHLVLVADGERFLCGHDERHWFVAGVRQRSASTVDQAMDALRPRGARESFVRSGTRHQRRHDRRNAGFLRQGEWFFLPAPDFRPFTVLRREPLQRGGSKPHMVDELARGGGEPVHVSRRYPNGLTLRQYDELRRSDPATFARQRWRSMTRGATPFARGHVRHPDHATIFLPGWHRVEMADDVLSKQVAFLD